MKKYFIVWLLAASGCVFGQSSGTDSLFLYMEMAARNNPAVHAAFLIYEAELQKSPQMSALDNPQLDMGFFLRPMELVEGRQIAQFQVMQMFPWFGTRKAARTEAEHMAKMAFEQFRETRDNLFLEVYTQWYVLCALQQKLFNNEENLTLLKQLETLALQRYRNPQNTPSAAAAQMSNNAMNVATPAASNMGGMNMGGNMPSQSLNPSIPQSFNPSMSMNVASSGMSEVLRVQIEMAELESNIESLRSEMLAGKARFNALLNRAAETAVAVPADLVQLPSPPDVATAMQTITHQNPMLGMLTEESLAYAARAEMERKMGYPMLGVGLQYMFIGKLAETGGSPMSGMGSTTGMSSMNGKDMVMPMVSVSIPVYRKKYRAAQKERQLMQQATDEKYADALNQLQAELYRTKHLLDDAERKIALYRKQAALTRSTYDLMVNEFTVGKSSLTDIIQVQRQLLDYRSKETEAVAGYNTTVVSIRKMISSADNEY
ncbi:MAG: TolC family protein [Bacteroidales bacterium]|jgi:outer membrane protein TolC|nr:TolC family protein [Bacteroidales bacterium]